MASLDVARPAAQEQLAVLGRQAERRHAADRRRPAAGRDRRARAPVGASCRPMTSSCSTPPGRLHVDDALMAEMKAVAAASQPGRDPAGGRQPDRPGRGQRRQGLCRRGRADRRHPDPHGRRCARRRGAVDARGHRQADQVRRRRRGDRRARGVPPERVAGRILGMGDVVSLVERAAETIEVEEAEKLAAKMAKGKFDLDDLRAQLGQMQRMGGLGALAGMMPGHEGHEGRDGQGAGRQGAGPPGGDDVVDDRQGAQPARDRSTPSARSASPRAAGPPSRRSTSCSRCTRKWRA